VCAVSNCDLGHEQQINDRQLITSSVNDNRSSTLRSQQEFRADNAMFCPVRQMQRKRSKRLSAMHCI
jgi:hypothetical protein